MAKLTWLGTGSAFNAADGNTASLLEVGDYKVLFDCGFTVPYELKRRGLLNAITHVFISHTHSDHAGGLELLAQWRYFVGQRQGVAVPRLIVPGDLLERLRLNEQLGLGNIQDEFGRPLAATLETYFNLHQLDAPSPYALAGANRQERVYLRYVPVDHVPDTEGRRFPSYGFMLSMAERDIWLSADCREVYTRPNNWSVSQVFHDCQLFESGCCGAGDVHASLDKLEREVPQAERAHYWLTHYGENWAEFQQRAQEAGFAGFVRPGMSFDLATGQLLE